MLNIKYMSTEEAAEAQKYIEEYNAKLQKKFKRQRNISNFFKCMFFSPLAICTRIVASILRLIGCILAIGMPYGIYCIYKTAEQLVSGVSYVDIEHTKWIVPLFILPFVLFGIYYLLDKLADYFDFNK